MDTAIALLQTDKPPALLALHHELPPFPSQALARHPRLREAASRLATGTALGGIAAAYLGAQ